MLSYCAYLLGHCYANPHLIIHSLVAVLIYLDIAMLILTSSFIALWLCLSTWILLCYTSPHHSQPCGCAYLPGYCYALPYLVIHSLVTVLIYLDIAMLYLTLSFIAFWLCLSTWTLLCYTLPCHSQPCGCAYLPGYCYALPYLVIHSLLAVLIYLDIAMLYLTLSFIAFWLCLYTWTLLYFTLPGHSYSFVAVLIYLDISCTVDPIYLHEYDQLCCFISVV